MGMKAMIIDDDGQIREGIRRAIRWENLGFDFVECFANGRDALQAFEEIKPDLMVCDIEMPQMSGLELGEEVRKTGADTRIIYLTAFSDFEYARSAMKVGARDYILKPVKVAELIASIQKNVKELTALREQADRAYNASLMELVTEIYGRRNKGRAADLFALIRTKHPSFNSSILHTILLETEGNDGFENEVFRSLQQDIEQEECIFLPWQMNQKICLCAGFHSAAENFNQRRKLLSLIRYSNNENGSPGMMIKAGISREHPGNNLTEGFDQAKEALADSFYNSLTVNICEEYPENEEKLRLRERLEADVHSLYEKGKNGSLKDLEDSFDKAADTAYRLHLPPDIFFRKMVGVYSSLRSLNGLSLQEETLLERMSACETVVQCRAVFTDALQTGNKEEWKGLLVKRKETYSHTIEKAIEFLEAHYKEPLSVSTAAEYVGKSDNHFSAVFKREVGLSFTEYLTRLRIMKACRLLSDTTMQVNEICREVGYSDYLYFSRTFKKVMGCTPSDVRSNK